ncbi:MAG: hypothetical protein HPY74_06905 [Firmicutes bacterium]|nr:hypothetical protein [Bacillota bacterium]
MLSKIINITEYSGEKLKFVAYPMGGMGAGMICLEGTGTLSHFSLRNKPDIHNEPNVFSAICIKGEKNIARVLEGPVPMYKIFGRGKGMGNGLPGKNYGLPRFRESSFKAIFPFGIVTLKDEEIPLDVQITGWSPFIPGDADNSSLPVAGLEFRFKNTANEKIECVYSFNAFNFMKTGAGNEQVLTVPNGFILDQPPVEEKPWEQGAFCAVVDDLQARVDCSWFRGWMFDTLTILWKNIEEGAAIEKSLPKEEKPSPGASIFVPFQLGPDEEKVIRLRLSWYVPETDLRFGKDEEKSENCGCGYGCKDKADTKEKYKPWYSKRFNNVMEVSDYWGSNYEQLYQKTMEFTRCFYDTTLPGEVIEAVAANLTILKSPTVLRQTDGRLWCWEGCCDETGCCYGTCTHVWNYTQALCHLFPGLERGLRQTEFYESQDEKGHQQFRASLPIRPSSHDFHAAADGQLGGIMKIYREWRISGDTQWLKQIWPKVKLSINYCIDTWDPKKEGILKEPHHNTYDIEFWGPDGMCNSFYLGALKAASLMAKAVGDDYSLYDELYLKCKDFLENSLFNGEYFIQKVQWEGLKARLPLEESNTETRELLMKEGPKYQYGNGCLSDGVIGAWMAEMCGIGEILDSDKVKKHLMSVYKYNLKKDLSTHVNPQRPGYAVGKEGGLLLCTWPKGGKPSLPFIYSDEVWTGIEYQVASHLMSMGYVDEGLDIVRTCRKRYDGSVRNPFNEYECGHWYARAMASYALLQGLTGIRYDAVEKVFYIGPRIKGDFRSFISTETGFGTAGVKDGKPFIEVKSGCIDVRKVVFGTGNIAYRGENIE